MPLHYIEYTLQKYALEANMLYILHPNHRIVWTACSVSMQMLFVEVRCLINLSWHTCTLAKTYFNFQLLRQLVNNLFLCKNFGPLSGIAHMMAT